MNTLFAVGVLFVLLGAGCASGPTIVDNGNLDEKVDLIRVTSPEPGDLVTNDVVITGEARGTWFFEATFPVTVYDANGLGLCGSYAQAEGEWMTEEFVLFSATFSCPINEATTATGRIVLEKDNPSGLPQNDDSAYYWVHFE